ncbi:hypothetical protein GOBAR_DD05998 [Gossypium barbadense]|nr:hypothetical protein GOBAR_DD05998 [Gossypium barbadense]
MSRRSYISGSPRSRKVWFSFFFETTSTITAHKEVNSSDGEHPFFSSGKPLFLVILITGGSTIQVRLQSSFLPFLLRSLNIKSELPVKLSKLAASRPYYENWIFKGLVDRGFVLAKEVKWKTTGLTLPSLLKKEW